MTKRWRLAIKIGAFAAAVAVIACSDAMSPGQDPPQSASLTQPNGNDTASKDSGSGHGPGPDTAQGPDTNTGPGTGPDTISSTGPTGPDSTQGGTTFPGDTLFDAVVTGSVVGIDSTVNPFIETMYFFTFQGEGQTLLTGVMATTNPFVVEHGSSDGTSVALSSIFGGGLVGLPVAVANKDFRGTFTQMHGINDYAVRLRTIDRGSADAYNIMWDVFVAGCMAPFAPEAPALLVLTELGAIHFSQVAYSGLARNSAVNEGDQVLMVSYGGPYGAVFGSASGRYGTTFGWHVEWHHPQGGRRAISPR